MQEPPAGGEGMVWMRWLITVPLGTDLDVLAAAVQSARGSIRRDADPIPLGEGEVVVFAEGPVDLPEHIESGDLPVLEVSPESDPEPYQPGLAHSGG
ncbi:MAG: hypothetical protein ACK5MT_10170 [Actinomycetales bacterium]